MSISNPEAKMKALHAADPMCSVRLLQTALVHLCLRSPENPPRTPMPSPPENLSIMAFRFELARTLSTWLGQPQRCPSRACQRAKVCNGDPPNCWRDEAPPTHQELELAKGLMRYNLDKLKGDPRWVDKYLDEASR